MAFGLCWDIVFFCGGVLGEEVGFGFVFLLVEVVRRGGAYIF